MATYNVGDLVQLTASFTTVATGAATNPTTTTITVRDPDGNITTPAVSTPSTGTFTAQVSATTGGTWQWRAVGTGACQAANQGQFYVEPNSF